jgi:hypothetical protein
VAFDPEKFDLMFLTNPITAGGTKGVQPSEFNATPLAREREAQRRKGAEKLTRISQIDADSLAAKERKEFSRCVETQ